MSPIWWWIYITTTKKQLHFFNNPKTVTKCFFIKCLINIEIIMNINANKLYIQYWHIFTVKILPLCKLLQFFNRLARIGIFISTSTRPTTGPGLCVQKSFSVSKKKIKMNDGCYLFPLAYPSHESSLRLGIYSQSNNTFNHKILRSTDTARFGY